MSKEIVQGFYASAKENEDLQKAILEAVSAGNVVALAKEKGFEFTQTEHDEFMAVIAEGMKLSDDQLEEVSGGIGLPHIPVPQCRLCCDQCDWTSGWKLDTQYRQVAALAALHTAQTGHYKFHPEHRIH